MRRSTRIHGLLVVLALVLPASTSLATTVGEAAAPGWPREIEVKEGRIVIYQPQLESLEDDKLIGRGAVSVTPTGSDEPIFGVIRFSARMATDRDARTMDVLDAEITHVGFTDAKTEHKDKFKKLLETEVPSWDMTISLDRVLAGLAVGQQQRDMAQGLNFDPPVILFADYPTVLILIDGEPRLEEIEDGDLKRVINTPYLIVLDPKSGKYYLDGGAMWFVADDVPGPWAVEKKPPKRVVNVRTPEDKQAAEESAKDVTDDRVPRIVVATEPTELIVVDGSPKYASISIELLYVMNTDSDVVVDLESQRHFVVLSGRWYAAGSLDGPWGHVPSDELPASFAQIPTDSSKAHLRTFVAGTQEANEALLENQIPQTAAVKLGPAELEIEYDGEPQFEPIEGTQMSYSVNTPFTVLEIEGRYWVCHEAVWYEGNTATGPWTVATKRPDEIDSIPADNPHYNVKYVYIYESTPEVVYVGYTPGYVGSYPYGGCVVYGTGWYYRPWYGAYYYPRPSTWGFRVSYNPWYGWSVGVSWSNGPFTFSIGRGGYGGYPHYGGYPRYGRYPPPAYRPGYPGHGNRPGYPGHGNRPGDGRPSTGRPSTGQPSTGRPSTGRPDGGRENVYNRPENRERNADRATRDRKSPATVSTQPNNVFADRDGNVHRKGSDGWERRDGNSWKPEAGGGSANRSGNRAQSGSSSLNRDYQARQRGNQRTDSWNRQQSSGGRSSMSGGSRGGGASRGGGGGRRR